MNPLQLGLMVLFHPTDAFVLIRADRSKFNYLPSLALLFAMVAVRISYIYAVHYPLAEVLPREANMWLEIATMLVPVLTWVLGCYAVTTIMNGETLMREMLMASAYAMLPYIVFMLPLAGISHFMSGSDAGLYSILQTIVWVWVFALYFISVQTINEYEFWQTVGICVLSLIAMVLIWAIAGLFYVLSSQLYHFIADLILEIRLMFME